MIHSFRVAATLSAYRVVACTGTANTVGYPEAATRMPVGITLDTVKDITQAIPVACVGELAKLYFQDSVASGQLVGGNTSGQGVLYTVAPNTSTSFTVSSCYVGVLVGPKVEATGSLGEVLVMPGVAKGSF